MSLWLDKLQKCWFVTRLVYHNLFLKNSSLNCVNRCNPQISPTELRLEFRSTRYSTREDQALYRGKEVGCPVGVPWRFQ